MTPKEIREILCHINISGFFKLWSLKSVTLGDIDTFIDEGIELGTEYYSREEVMNEFHDWYVSGLDRIFTLEDLYSVFSTIKETRPYMSEKAEEYMDSFWEGSQEYEIDFPMEFRRRI